jgi:hypothetical protein
LQETRADKTRVPKKNIFFMVMLLQCKIRAAKGTDSNAACFKITFSYNGGSVYNRRY